MPTSRFVGALALALVVAGAGAGCGSGGAKVIPRGEAPVTWLLFDCSGFRRLVRVSDSVTEMVEVAEHAATARQTIRYMCVDGQPLTTARIRTTDFSLPLANDPTVPQDRTMIAVRNHNEAVALRGSFETMIAHGRVWRWSGLLEGLTFPAEDPRMRTVYFWTDGEIRDPATGFNLPTASAQRTQEELDRWRSRLAGLAGKTLIVIGGGLGAQNEATAIRAHDFFYRLVHGEEGGHLVWVPTLAEVGGYD